MPDIRRLLARAARRLRPSARPAAGVGLALLAIGALLLVSGLTAPPAHAAESSTQIVVRVGSDRVAGTTVASPLDGVTLELLSTATGQPVGAAWSTCVSSAGTCTFTVPDTGLDGANYYTAFDVVQSGAPSGYFANPTLTTGDSSGPFTSRPYRFRTPQMRGAETIRSGYTFMSTNPIAPDTLYNGSTGVWQSSRDNPVLDVCGATIAIVLDVSASVNAAQFVQLKAAATSMVSALQGTPSRVAVFLFGTQATENIQAVPVASAAQVASLNARINALTQPSGQWTNWDAAFAAVNASGTSFDEAIMITDGSPTTYGTTSTPSGTVRTVFSPIEAGIFSANALKAAGTRIVAIGVGAGLQTSADNLAAISGPQLGSDYFQSPDFSQAAATLKQIAQGNCIPSLSVVKEVLPFGSTDPDQGDPSGGWTFDVSDATPAGGPAATISGTPGTTEDGSGAVNFPLAIDPVTGLATLQVAEEPGGQQGFTYLPALTSCRDIATGDAVTATAVPNANAFTIQMDGGQGVSCTVYNQAPDPTVFSTLQLDKQWIVNGTSYDQANRPAGLSSTLTLDGDDAEFGELYEGYRNLPAVTVGERTSITIPGCELTGSSFEFNGATAALGPVQLLAGDNTGTITNVVECTGTLTLAKEVQGGDADPALWTLTATGPAGSAPGPSGATGTPEATATVTSGVQYVLSESGGDPLYAQQDLRDPALAVPGSTGSWRCEPLSATGRVLIGTNDEAVNGGITLALGESMICTATNQTASLTLAKTVENNNIGTAVPSDWTLTATPAAGSTLPVASVTGSTDGTAVQVRPGLEYTLGESGPSGYALTSLECDTGADGAFVPATTVTVPGLADITCRYVNAVTTLPATGTRIDGQLGAGLAALGGGLALLVLARMRRRAN